MKTKALNNIMIDYSIFLRLKCAETLFGMKFPDIVRLAIADWLEGNDIPIVTEEDIQSIQEGI